MHLLRPHVIAGWTLQRYKVTSLLADEERTTYTLTLRSFEKRSLLSLFLYLSYKRSILSKAHSRFPGSPQAPPLPVGHVAGRVFLAGHVPGWLLLLDSLLHPGVQGPQGALPHQVTILQTHH